RVRERERYRLFRPDATAPVAAASAPSSAATNSTFRAVSRFFHPERDVWMARWEAARAFPNSLVVRLEKSWRSLWSRAACEETPPADFDFAVRRRVPVLRRVRAAVFCSSILFLPAEPRSGRRLRVHAFNPLIVFLCDDTALDLQRRRQLAAFEC